MVRGLAGLLRLPNAPMLKTGDADPAGVSAEARSWG